MSGFSGSAHGSGCESGWTVYLEESGGSSEDRVRREEEGDLSMVSDASSGPPNGFDGGEMGGPGSCRNLDGGFPAGESAVRREREEKRNVEREMELKWKQRSYLDDTASSRKEMNIYPYRKEGHVESVQDFSSSQLKKPTALFQPTSAKKSARKVPGNFQDPKWE